MEDSRIIELYWQRSENAITETDKKYGAYCNTVAFNILQNKEDADECVNDTWLGTWDTIPPNRPTILRAFLAKITRNLSIKRLEKKLAEKRGGSTECIVLDELEECIGDQTDVEGIVESHELEELIRRFVRKLPRGMAISLCVDISFPIRSHRLQNANMSGEDKVHDYVRADIITSDNTTLALTDQQKITTIYDILRTELQSEAAADDKHYSENDNIAAGEMADGNGKTEDIGGIIAQSQYTIKLISADGAEKVYTLVGKVVRNESTGETFSLSSNQYNELMEILNQK